MYNASSVSIPTIREKGELQLEGVITPMSESPIFALPRASAAYGLTNHVALAANLDLPRQWMQVMGGLYFPMDEKFVWEIYGGFGIGHGTYGGFLSKSEDYASYKMAFVQGDCGWRNLTEFMHLDVALSLKTGMAFYHRTFLNDTYDGSSNEPYYTEQEGRNFVINPMLELRFGWEKIKFNVKVGFPYLIPDASGFRLDAPSVDAGAGVSLFLSPKR